jgi:hypothetical protein
VIHRSVQKKSSTENPAEDFCKTNFSFYCAGGDSAGVSSVPAGDSVTAAGASVAAGLVIFVVTVVDLTLLSSSWQGIWLLGQILFGYALSWRGALIGLLWGFVLGFCAGWFVAFVRNLVMAISLFILQTRAELDDTRDFLDHI